MKEIPQPAHPSDMDGAYRRPGKEVGYGESEFESTEIDFETKSFDDHIEYMKSYLQGYVDLSPAERNTDMAKNKLKARLFGSVETILHQAIVENKNAPTRKAAPPYYTNKIDEIFLQLPQKFSFAQDFLKKGLLTKVFAARCCRRRTCRIELKLMTKRRSSGKVRC